MLKKPPATALPPAASSPGGAFIMLAAIENILAPGAGPIIAEGGST